MTKREMSPSSSIRCVLEDSPRIFIAHDHLRKQSGTGVLMDSARGEYPTETIYSDMNVEQLKSIPDTAIHRNVECLVVEADEQGYVRSHIILPSTVYAIAKNPLVDAGISNAHSVHIPLVIRGSLDRKRAGMVGKGKSIQSSIHIDDSEWCLRLRSRSPAD